MRVRWGSGGGEGVGCGGVWVGGCMLQQHHLVSHTQLGGYPCYSLSDSMLACAGSREVQLES